MKDIRLLLWISALLACLILPFSIMMMTLLAASFPSEEITPAYEYFLDCSVAIALTSSGFIFIGVVGEQIVLSLRLRILGGLLLTLQIIFFSLTPFLGGIHYEVVPLFYPFLILSVLQFAFFIWPLHTKNSTTIPSPLFKK
jgi:hypothetical protein